MMNKIPIAGCIMHRVEGGVKPGSVASGIRGGVCPRHAQGVRAKAAATGAAESAGSNGQRAVVDFYPGLKFFRRYRSGIQIPLRVIAVCIDQQVALVFCLDTLGNDF